MRKRTTSESPEITVIEHPRRDDLISREYRSRLFISDPDTDDGFLSSISFCVETSQAQGGTELMTGGRIEFRDCSRSVSWSFDGVRPWNMDSENKEIRRGEAKAKRALGMFQTFVGLMERYAPSEPKANKKKARTRRPPQTVRTRNRQRGI